MLNIREKEKCKNHVVQITQFYTGINTICGVAIYECENCDLRYWEEVRFELQE